MKQSYFKAIYNFLINIDYDNSEYNHLFNILYPTDDFTFDNLPVSYRNKKHIKLYLDLEAKYLKFILSIMDKHKLNFIKPNHFDLKMDALTKIRDKEVLEYYLKLGLREELLNDGIYIPYLQTSIIFHFDLKLLVFSKSENKFLEFKNIAKNFGLDFFQ